LRLYGLWRWRRGECGRDITIYVGTLDDPEQFHPQAAIFVRSRPSWACVRGDVPEYDEMVLHE